MSIGDLRESMRQRRAAVVIAVAVVAAAGWWYSRRVDGASIVSRVNASYSSVAGYDADVFAGMSGAPTRLLYRRHAVIVAGRLSEMTEETAKPASGRPLRTYANASLLAGTVDGHPCWTKSSDDAQMISRDLGVGQPMIPSTDRLTAAHRGGHGYLIETTAQSGLGQPIPTIWDIDDATFMVRSRTTTANGLTTKVVVTRVLSAAPPLVRPDVICAS
jgi:hypothetical protein